MTEQISLTYNIHYLRMEETQWEALRHVYKQLPEFVGYPDGIPCWFGLEPDDAGGETDVSSRYLSASVEPSGLLVEGRLPLNDWAQWQQAFASLASSALGFAVKAAEDDTDWPYVLLKQSPRVL